MKLIVYGKSNCSTESFRNCVGVWDDGNAPSHQAPRSCIHPCCEHRPNSNFLFVQPVVPVAFQFHPHKQVKDMVVPLPVLIYQHRFLPYHMMPVLTSPLPCTFSAVTKHLWRNLAEESVQGSAVVGDNHSSFTFCANGFAIL